MRNPQTVLYLRIVNPGNPGTEGLEVVVSEYGGSFVERGYYRRRQAARATRARRLWEQ